MIAYIEPEEEPEESIDYDMERTQLVTDLIYGDLVPLGPSLTSGV